MATIAYIRVSDKDQNGDLQRDCLERMGYDRMFDDPGVSAVAEKREGFEAALAALAPGDVFLVWKNDRAFRSLKDAIVTMEYFQSIGVTFRSATEFIDTSTPMGRAMFYIQNVFAQLEREINGERTKAGMAAAKRRGKHVGRPRTLSQSLFVMALAMLESGEAITAADAAHSLRVSPRKLENALKAKRGAK